MPGGYGRMSPPAVVPRSTVRQEQPDGGIANGHPFSAADKKLYHRMCRLGLAQQDMVSAIIEHDRRHVENSVDYNYSSEHS